MRIELNHNFADIPAQAWDALAGQQPFLQHAFLAGLGTSGSATSNTGWSPQLLSLCEGDARIGCLPLYAKAHSRGEFVFDWAWADAYARHGRAYYPKLIAAVPFSPIQGPRLLATERETQGALLDAALQHASAGGFSSLHFLFPESGELPLYQERGLLLREGVQFHWQNPAYRDFDDFLDSLQREKRKKIRQERRRVAEAGLQFVRLTGDDLTSEHLAFAWRCYANTYAVRGQLPYLTPEFFQLLLLMRNQVLLVLALRESYEGAQPVAMALNLYQGETLWGRYWGCVEEVPCLHFEACYYQVIEFCIAQGIRCFEGGAQGEHKLARGFMPVTTWSAHWVADPDFRAAIGDFLNRERRGIAAYVDELNEHQPFRGE